MSTQRVMVLPPKAVSRLFDACANTAEGDDCPSCSISARISQSAPKTGTSTGSARTQNNGVLPGGSSAQEARDNQRQQEYEDYLAQLWQPHG